MRRDTHFRKRAGERGAALLLAIIAIFILTIFGLALVFTTTTELQIAGVETTTNRLFYAADSGVQYAIAQSRSLQTTGSCKVKVGSDTFTNYFCFAVPENMVNSTTTKPVTVQVSPFNQTSLQALTPQKGRPQFYNVGYHFTSTANDSSLNSTKSLAVEFVIGPVPQPP